MTAFTDPNPVPRNRFAYLIREFAVRTRVRAAGRWLLRALRSGERQDSEAQPAAPTEAAAPPTDTRASTRTDPAGHRGSDGPGLGWTELGLATVSLLALSVLAGSVATLILGHEPATLLALLLDTGAAVGAVSIAVAARVRSLAAVGLKRVDGRWIRTGAAWGALVWLLNAALLVGYMALTEDWSLPQPWLTDAASRSVPDLIGVLFAGALLAPFGEELLFRGVGYGALRRYGVFVAAAGSSAVFGLAHGFSVVLPAAIVLGVVAALLYERSGSIWPAVTAHVVNNAIVFMVAAIFR